MLYGRGTFVADHLLAAGRGYAAAAPHVLAAAEPGDAAAADVLRRAAHEVLDTMSTTSVTLIRQAFELTAADDPARGEIGAEVVAILARARQFDAAVGFADTLLAASISPDLRARVRLLLLPRLWSTGRRAELGVLAGVGGPSGSSVLAAEQAEREGDYARTHELFAAACAATQETTGVGLPEAGQLAAREVLALARLDDDMRFPDSWQAPQLALLRARLAYGAGRLEDAAAAAATAAALMAELGDSTFGPELRRLTALIALLRGDMSRVRMELAAARQAGDELPLVRALLAGPARRNPDVASVTGAWLLAEALTTNDYAAAMTRLRHSPRALLTARADEEYGRFQLDAGNRVAGNVTALRARSRRSPRRGARWAGRARS